MVWQNTETCDQCGKHKTQMFDCIRCKGARYCNSTCQRLGWSSHKRVCRELEKASRTKQKKGNPAKVKSNSIRRWYVWYVYHTTRHKQKRGSKTQQSWMSNQHRCRSSNDDTIIYNMKNTPYSIARNLYNLSIYYLWFLFYSFIYLYFIRDSTYLLQLLLIYSGQSLYL